MDKAKVHANVGPGIEGEVVLSLYGAEVGALSVIEAVELAEELLRAVVEAKLREMRSRERLLHLIGAPLQ